MSPKSYHSPWIKVHGANISKLPIIRIALFVTLAGLSNGEEMIEPKAPPTPVEKPEIVADYERTITEHRALEASLAFANKSPRLSDSPVNQGERIEIFHMMNLRRFLGLLVTPVLLPEIQNPAEVPTTH